MSEKNITRAYASAIFVNGKTIPPGEEISLSPARAETAKKYAGIFEPPVANATDDKSVKKPATAGTSVT